MALFQQKKSDTFFLNSKTIVLILIFLTISRIFVLHISPLELSVDEAQYWDWSRNLQFGYFSKPPLIAWLISFSTFVFGSEELAVRLFSPILHFLISIILWIICIKIYGNDAGKFAALIWCTLPLTGLGSFIISTDTPLLFFWSLSLLALTNIIKEKSFIWTILLGVFLGFGFLTKYAMIYFVIFLIIFWLIYDRNKFIKFYNLILIFILFFLFSLPNIYWNYANEFSTINHVIYNADLEKINFNFNHVLTFLISQFFVFGPVTFLIFFFTVWSFFFKEAKLSILAFFSITIVFALTIQAFLKTSNANWAVTAYPAACIIIAGFLAEKKNKALRFLINIGIFLNIIISLFVIKVTLYGDINPIELKSDPLRKLKGFEVQSRELTRLINEERPVAIIFNRRSEITRFNYYMQKDNVYYNKAYFLTETVIPKNHYEYFFQFKINDFKSKEKLIIITREKGIDRKYLDKFESFNLLKISKFKNSKNTYRILYVFKGELR